VIYTPRTEVKECCRVTVAGQMEATGEFGFERQVRVFELVGGSALSERFKEISTRPGTSVVVIRARSATVVSSHTATVDKFLKQQTAVANV
jgi:hypothetical protein